MAKTEKAKLGAFRVQIGEHGEEGEFLRLRQFQPSIHQLYTRNWRRRRISPSSPISTVNPPTLHTKLAKKENFSVFANFNRRPTNFTHEIGEEGEFLHEIGEEGEFLRFRQFQPSIHQLNTRNWRRRRISPSSPSSPIWNLNSVNFRNEIGEEGGFLQIHGFHFYKWWRCWFQNKNLR